MIYHLDGFLDEMSVLILCPSLYQVVCFSVTLVWRFPIQSGYKTLLRLVIWNYFLSVCSVATYSFKSNLKTKLIQWKRRNSASILGAFKSPFSTQVGHTGGRGSHSVPEQCYWTTWPVWPSQHPLPNSREIHTQKPRYRRDQILVHKLSFSKSKIFNLY